MKNKLDSVSFVIASTLIEDLIKAVRYAAWKDPNGQPNLTGPTPHMKTAMANLERKFFPICHTCNQRII